MELYTYYYYVNPCYEFVLTHNKEKLQKPIDLQFFIEILKLKYDIYLQVFPTKNNKIIKANIEIDKKDLYYNIEFKLRNYIKKHYI
tara:strand:- start:274 stop:531 length:258 start_codon:yes stop_codon:yes gene_type:complete